MKTKLCVPCKIERNTKTKSITIIDGIPMCQEHKDIYNNIFKDIEELDEN